MAIVPIRGLSKYGVLTDPDAYSLPPEAFSMGVNVRFHAGSVLRAPVFRNILNLGTASPRFLTANNPSSGFTSLVVGYKDGKASSITNGIESDISIASYTPVDSEGNYTAARLADVFYLNRPNRVPWSLLPADTAMGALANWPTDWRANILRSCSGALCAFGITKAGVFYPTMVKTSEFAFSGEVPSTWDEADATADATENILAEMTSPITDAQNLGELMMVYGLKETWTMTMDGSANLWSYRKLYGDRGSINVNCAVEVNKKHYVFGVDDIWVHDGVSPPVSIADQRVREFVFSNIDMGKTNRCFVTYNARLKEISFCFSSGDGYTGFVANDGCNRAAVYNVAEDTWTFYDLPYVYGAAEANTDTVATWASVNSSWASFGGSWADQNNSEKRVQCMVGDDDTTNSLTRSVYAIDEHGPNSIIGLATDVNATKGWTLERDGIDLDQVGVDLKGYKVVNSIYPRARMEVDATPISFTFGAADYFNQPPIMGPEQTYDGDTLYKLDYNIAGRYLFMRAFHADFNYVNITGFDLDMDVLGER